jgi:outer membrane immunogenic protein
LESAVLRFVTITAFLSLAGMVTSASAAPISSAAEAAAYNWTGAFAGLNVGYGWGRSDRKDLTVVDPPPFGGGAGGFDRYNAAGGFQFPNVSPQGAIGGAQVGYNFQTGRVVWGALADFQFSDITDISTVNVPSITLPPGVTFFAQNQTHSTTINWFGTARGRVGYAFNNFLPYVSGGLAYGRIESQLNVFIPATGANLNGIQAMMRTGWTAGGGFNYAVNEHVVMGVDYLYIDFGDDTITANTGSLNVVRGTTISMTQHVTANVLRAVLEYKF